MSFKQWGLQLITNAFLILICLSYSEILFADGWSFFSQKDQMKGYVIADIGDVSSVEPPYNTKWEQDVFQLNGRCFILPSYLGIWGFGDKAGMLLVNAQKLVQLALFETSIGSIDVKMESVTMIECPSGADIIPYSSDPKERLRLLKEKQKALQNKLDEVKKK